MFGNPYYAPYQYPNFYAQNDPYKLQNQQQVQTTNSQAQMQNTANFQPKNDMLWVLNKNEADSYPVAPNCSVVLWDKNAPTIYVKSMSANGVPSMRTLDFKERVENVQNQPAINEKDLDGKFVTIEQFDDLRADFNGLKAEYDKLIQLQSENNTKSEEKPKATVKKSKGGDE